MDNYLFTNATVITMGMDNHVIEDGYVATSDGLIEALGPMATLDHSAFTGYERIDCHTGYKRHLLLPGFIQTHLHTTQALGRGLADDVDLHTWTRKRIWPYESALTEEDAYVSALLSIASMIRSGTTGFCEASGQHPDSIANAIIDSGIKGIVCLSTMDIPGEFPDTMYLPTPRAIEANFSLVERWRGKHERVDACLNLLNLFNTSETLWKEFHAYSKENDVLVQAHVAEALVEVDYTLATYGKTPVRLVDSWGCLSPRLLAAHMVHIDDEEIELVRQHEVKLQHLPAADLRIAGFAPIAKCLALGINISLGTNSPPCNNRMSMMDEMWLAGLMHKAIHNDPQAVPASAVLRMATIGGARALGWERQTGSLEIGKRADLIAMDMNKLVGTPTHHLASTIVYQATGEVVDTVMVNGKILMRDRKLTTINEEWLVQEAERRAQTIVKRAGIRY